MLKVTTISLLLKANFWINLSQESKKLIQFMKKIDQTEEIKELINLRSKLNGCLTLHFKLILEDLLSKIMEEEMLNL